MKIPAIGWLRLEGLAVLGAALLAYGHFHFSWGWFAALILAPDLSMLGYLAGPRIGAWAYNLVHTYALALPIVGIGLLADRPNLLAAGLILCAHSGMDRAIGYGLKSRESFKQTHLGVVGRARS